MKLTVEEKIILHLYRCRYWEKDTGERQTQAGIARACGTNQGSTATEISKLMKLAAVREKRTAIHGRMQRRLTAYSLTEQGELMAEELLREIEALHKRYSLLMKTMEGRW